MTIPPPGREQPSRKQEDSGWMRSKKYQNTTAAVWEDQTTGRADQRTDFLMQMGLLQYVSVGQPLSIRAHLILQSITMQSQYQAPHTVHVVSKNL
jgi:hypothetical protein